MRNPYIPFLLPNDDLVGKEKLFDKAIKASTEIAIYNETLKNSKIKPEILIDLLSLKEALESSKIEGIQTTMDEILEYRTDSQNPSVALREVMRYHFALHESVYKLDRLPLSSRLIKELHRTLMTGGVRRGTKNPSNFRTIQNFIGPEGCTLETASYVPPEPHLVAKYISNLEKFINEDPSTNDLIKIAIIHAQFETIHPFLDGNGRIGRILIPLYLYDKKVINTANLFVSESLERDKHKYYSLLNGTRVVVADEDYDEEQYLKDMNLVKNNYTEWIAFFLSACIKEAQKVKIKILKINELFEDTLKKSKLLVNSSRMVDVINLIFEYPIFNTKRIRDRLNIAPATLNGYLNKLVDARIVYSDEKAINRKYYFYDLIDILR